MSFVGHFTIALIIGLEVQFDALWVQDKGAGHSIK